EGFRPPAFAGGDVVHRAAGGDGAIFFHHRLDAFGTQCVRVAMFDQEPVRALATVAIVLHAHDHEAALQALSVEGELELALFELFLRRAVAERFPIAPIPKLYRAAAILSFGDRAFEVAVVERMILDLDREALVLRIERWAPRHGPRLEDAVELEPQVEVQARRGVLLNHIAQAPRRFDRQRAARLGGLRE